MNHKRVPEVATKGETIDESKIKSQMASKSIDTLDDANDHDTEEENRQVLEEEVEIEDSTIEKKDKVKDIYSYFFLLKRYFLIIKYLINQHLCAVKVDNENKDVFASTRTLTKVKDKTSCRLMIGTNDNVVGSGTIFDYDMDGDNVKVSMDMLPMVIASSLFQQGKMKSV
ncbi:hypothetical protein IC582_013859 [Cucumis melo]